MFLYFLICFFFLEPIQTEPIIEEEPAPVYNTLEPPSEEDDYDDVVDVRGKKV